MNEARTRAVIVVLDDNVTDVEAALIRNGLFMFRRVRKVLPVRGVPSDPKALRTIAQNDVAERLREVETELAEARARLEMAQQATTGPMPAPSALDDGTIEWKPAS